MLRPLSSGPPRRQAPVRGHPQDVLKPPTLARFVAYLIWFTAVQRLGNTRTSAYSNLTPAVAMIVAWLWIGERVMPVQVGGAAASLVGVALTRLRVRGEPLPHQRIRLSQAGNARSGEGCPLQAPEDASARVMMLPSRVPM